jgi:hypothetical protein
MDGALTGVMLALHRRGEYDAEIRKLCAPIAQRAFGSRICPVDDIYASCLVSISPDMNGAFTILRSGDIAHSFYARVVLDKGQSVENAFHSFEISHGGARAEYRSMAKTVAMCKSRGVWPSFTNRAAKRAAEPGLFREDNVDARTAYVPLLIECPTNLPLLALYWYESQIIFYDVHHQIARVDAIVHETVFIATAGRRGTANMDANPDAPGHQADAEFIPIEPEHQARLAAGIPLPADHPAAGAINPYVAHRPIAAPQAGFDDAYAMSDEHPNAINNPFPEEADAAGEFVYTGPGVLQAGPIPQGFIAGFQPAAPPVRLTHTVGVIERSTVEWQYNASTGKRLEARIEAEINAPATAVVIALHFEHPIDAAEHPLRFARLLLDDQQAYCFDAPMLEEINWQRCGLIAPTDSYKFREKRQDFLYLMPFSREAFSMDPPTAWINFAYIKVAKLRMELAQEDYGEVSVVLSAHTVEIRGYAEGMSGRHLISMH